MKASDLARELRRIARREVPNGEPNLWPEIRRQLERAGAGGMSHQFSDAARSRADLDTSYVWHADTPRRRRFGTFPAALAGSLVLVLLVAGLALALGNRGDDSRAPVGIGNVSTATPAATPATSTTPANAWPSNGTLRIPINPINGSDISGHVTAQLLPSGALRLASGLSDAKNSVVFHLVAAGCDRASADIPSKTNLIPPFTSGGGYYAFVPEAQTHQQLALAALRSSDGTLAACALIPPVPPGTTPQFSAAPEVPDTCPVTLPGQPAFIPPGATPAPPHFIYGDFWYGTSKLWTSLPFDGVWNGGKSFWWAEGYSWTAEPLPELTVTGMQIDGDGSTVADGATNGNGGGTGSFMLVGVNFPTTGCWQVSGTYKGTTLSFVVWVDQVDNPVTPTPTPIPTTSSTPIPSIDVPVATPNTTPTPLATTTTCAVDDVLSRFIAAFNANDQTTLAAMLPEQALGGNRWLAVITSSNPAGETGDTLIKTRDAFLAYVTARHQQHEALGISAVVSTDATWPAGASLVTVNVTRQADDLPNQELQAVARVSCDPQLVDSWTLGTMPSSSDGQSLTSEDLISQTLRARPLHIDDIDMTGGICPVDLPHSVDPNLGPALGDGPLYVVMGQADENGVNHMPVNSGWIKFKVIWTSDPSYTGPVLVRGMQIDGPNQMRFGGNDPPDLDLSFMAPHDNTYEVTYTRVNAPGCYAYQVDGINFSELIVTSFQP